MSYRTTGLKRKRSSAAGVLMVARPYKKPYTRKRMFIPGRDRVGGYYGRYAGRNSELKFHDHTFVDAFVAATGDIDPSLNLIAQGTAENERIGRKCVIKSIDLIYSLSLYEQDAVTKPKEGDSVRMIVYIDKQANGATASKTDLLESALLHSPYNLSNSGRFIFLMDKIHNINYAGLASDGAGVVSQAENLHTYKWHKNCNMPVEFDSTTGAITEIRSNNLGLLLISATSGVRWTGTWRLRFSDGG